MSFRSIGTNLTGDHRRDLSSLSEELDRLAGSGPDFLELWPDKLGLINAGRLDEARAAEVHEILAKANLPVSVHAPLEIDLMDISSGLPHREALESSLRFAGEAGAEVLVCHAGQRRSVRDARLSLKAQIAAERESLLRAGDLASESGVTIAVENYYPEAPLLRGEVYDSSLWPSELADRVGGLDHSSVAICLDTGHAALAAEALGFDLFGECAAAAPLVRHIHIHDNFCRIASDTPDASSEQRVFGLGDLHLPPGMGDIPLTELFRDLDFPREPSCCAELSDEFPHLYEEALRGARRIRDVCVSHSSPVETSGGASWPLYAS